MFSATWPTSVQKLANTFLKTPIKVSVSSSSASFPITNDYGEPEQSDSQFEVKLSANKNVRQIIEVIEADDRNKRLLSLLKEYHGSRKNRVLIFVLYKNEAGYLENFLNRNGWYACSIHGNKNQSQRTEALQNFVSGKVPLLVATDVAGRGLDIPKVEYVINYTFPLTIEDYVHRIGRTGRAGATGIAHTFFQKFDKAHSGELVFVLRESKQEVPEDLLSFGIATKKKEPKLGKIDLQQSNSKHITFDSDDE